MTVTERSKSLRTRLVRSFEMRLPEAARAVVEIEKLRHYCLDATHPRGRHKARVFASALGIQQSDAEWLRTKLLDAVLQNNAMKGESDEYGTRYILDFECTRSGRSATVRSGWIIRPSEGVPRLTTCYVLSE